MKKNISFLLLFTCILGNSYADTNPTQPSSSTRELTRDLNQMPIISNPIGAHLMRQEVATLTSRFDALESILKKQKEDYKTQLAALKKELLTVIDQKCSEAIDILNQKNAETTELNRVLVKYGNNSEGLPALHCAIKSGDVSTVNLLIANGADSNAITPTARLEKKSFENVTALSMAAIHNQYEIAKILLENDADPNFVAYNSGNLPIKYAAEYASGDFINLLVKHGAQIDKTKLPVEERKEDSSETPLHIASKTGNFETVVALVNAGVPVNPGILDTAATSLKYEDNLSNLDLVKFLVSKGAVRANPYNYDSIACPVIGGYLRSISK